MMPYIEREYIYNTYIWMNHSRSLVTILVAMQWANEDVFNSGSISCNAALRGRREGGKRHVCGEGIRHSREHGRRRERGRCRPQNDRWLLQVPCVPCHIKCIWPPPPLYTHKHTTCTCIYTHLYSAIHIVAVRKLIQWLYFSLEHFFYSEKLYLGKEGTIVLSDQPNPLTASHT